jgi:hypothetical protein
MSIYDRAKYVYPLLRLFLLLLLLILDNVKLFHLIDDTDETTW